MSNQLLLEALEEMVRCAQKQNWRDNYPSAMDKAYAALEATKATQPADGEPVTIKLPPKPYVGPEGYCELTSYEQGELQGRCDMYELIRELNSWTAPPASAHGGKPK